MVVAAGVLVFLVFVGALCCAYDQGCSGFHSSGSMRISSLVVGRALGQHNIPDIAVAVLLDPVLQGRKRAQSFISSAAEVAEPW